MLASKIVSYGLAAAVAAMLVVTVIGSTSALLQSEGTTADQNVGAAPSKP